jgi:uncharacterized alkaline shock family protein YloU
MRQTEHGGTYISLEALDTMVQKHCRALARVRDVHTTLHSTETGVTIGIRLCVLPDTDVVTLSSELQKSLKENIEALTGIQVNEIGVLVESAAAPANTPAAVSRLSEDRIMNAFWEFVKQHKFTVLLVLVGLVSGDSVFHHRFLAHDPAVSDPRAVLLSGLHARQRRPRGIRDFFHKLFSRIHNT